MNRPLLPARELNILRSLIEHTLNTDLSVDVVLRAMHFAAAEADLECRLQRLQQTLALCGANTARPEVRS